MNLTSRKCTKTLRINNRNNGDLNREIRALQHDDNFLDHQLHHISILNPQLVINIVGRIDVISKMHSDDSKIMDLSFVLYKRMLVNAMSWIIHMKGHQQKIIGNRNKKSSKIVTMFKKRGMLLRMIRVPNDRILR